MKIGTARLRVPMIAMRIEHRASLRQCGLLKFVLCVATHAFKVLSA